MEPDTDALEMLRLRDEPRLGMSEALFSGWGFDIPAMNTRSEFDAAMRLYGTPEELWEKIGNLARTRGATEKDLDVFSRINSPESLLTPLSRGPIILILMIQNLWSRHRSAPHMREL